MLRSVSFFELSRERMPGQKHMTGGLAHTAVKKLKGARFGAPLLLTVETKAIGRGRTTPTNNFSMSCTETAAGSTVTYFFSIQLAQDRKSTRLNSSHLGI